MTDDGVQENNLAVNDDDRKLFIGGLAQEAAEKDLKEYFAKFGDVSSVTLKMDQMTGRSRWGSSWDLALSCLYSKEN